MSNNEITKEENSLILNQILENIDNKAFNKDDLIENLENELNEDINKLKNEKITLKIPEQNNSNTKTSTKQISTSAKSNKQNSLQSETFELKEKTEEKKDSTEIINKEKDENKNVIIKEEKNIEQKNNIDDLPIKANNLNFTQLLEKELLKEENNESNISSNKKVEPKFKYVSKKKSDVEFKKPIKNKKYKYYSDNFKIKPLKNSGGNKSNAKDNDKDDIYQNTEKNKKENKINNKTKTSKKINNKKNEEEKWNNIIKNNDISNDNNLNQIDIENDNFNYENENEDYNINIQKEIQNENNENENDNNEKINYDNNNKIEDEDNIILMNNFIEMKKAEIGKNKKRKKPKKEDKDLINILKIKDNDIFLKDKNIDEEEYENDIKKISDYLYHKNNPPKQSKDKLSQEISDIINTNKNINENNINNDYIDEDLEEKKIFEQFYYNLNKQRFKKSSSKSRSKSKTKRKAKNKTNKNKQKTREVRYNIENKNKYYHVEENIKEENIKDENIKDENINENYNFYRNENNYNKEENIGINELVAEKKNELNEYLEILKKEINNVNELKKEYEKININYNNEINGHERKKEELKYIYNLKKDEEIKKIEKEREILKNEKLFTDFPKTKKINEVLYYQNEIEKMEIEIKNREEYFKKTIEKLENQYIETNQINMELRNKLKIYENKENNDDENE